MLGIHGLLLLLLLLHSVGLRYYLCQWGHLTLTPRRLPPAGSCSGYTSPRAGRNGPALLQLLHLLLLLLLLLRLGHDVLDVALCHLAAVKVAEDANCDILRLLTAWHLHHCTGLALQFTDLFFATKRKQNRSRIVDMQGIIEDEAGGGGEGGG